MMKSRYLALLLITAIVGSLALLAPSAIQADTERPREASLSQLAIRETGLSFQLEIPDPQLDQGTVSVAGLTQRIAEPGAPTLPYYSTLIAVPPEAEIEVDVRPATAQSEQLRQPLDFNPQHVALELDDPEMLLTATPDVDREALLWEPDPAIFEADTPYPGNVYAVTTPMYYRDVRFVRLDLHPLHYVPQQESLRWHPALDVSVTFRGAQPAGNTIGGNPPAVLDALGESFINFEQALQWRSLPDSFAPQATTFPIGVETFKIEIDEDGIYDLTYNDLANAGMPVDTVDPNTFEMMHQGQPVAYQFLGDDDTSFESGEAVRFYGWAFDGSRRDDDYIDNNVFWIWAGGTPTLVSAIDESGNFPTATSFQERALVDGPVTLMWTSGTNQWDQFPNEGDQFYMDRLRLDTNTTTWTYDIDLLHPATAASQDVLIRAELLSYRSYYTVDGNGNTIEIPKEWQVTINNAPTSEIESWYGRRNADVTTLLPASNLISGTNVITVTGLADLTNLVPPSPALPDQHFLNELSVDYQRLFRAVGNQLIFTHAGDHAFDISHLSVADTNQIFVWDITDRLEPTKVTLDSGNFSGAPGDYTVSFDAAGIAERSFVVSTEGTVDARTPANISSYTAPSLDPAGGAEWLAIAYDGFISETETLALHRSDPLYGGYSTQVVDVEDVYNQYGYGYAYPAAIHDYLAHALTWPTAPRYVLLVGDANLNMQGLDVDNYSWWAENEPNYVISDLQFVDRFQGMVPTDHTFTLLVGDDLVSDLAIGRLAVQNVPELTAAVTKIIQYEFNQTQASNFGFLQNMVFVADKFDPSAGDFCFENQKTADYIPDYFDDPDGDGNIEHELCFDDYATVEDLRTDLSTLVNGFPPQGGASMVMYRGHGSVNRWSGAQILSTDNMTFWQNADLPIILLSMDCLDSNFTFPGLPSLAESVLAYSSGGVPLGSAAQWSSTGLGYSYEHDVLARELMRGIFEHGLTALGDAAVYSKTIYEMGVFHESELYTFTLHGDPAMQTYRPDLSVTKSVSNDAYAVGDTAEYTITVENSGLYPGHATVTDSLPAGMSYVSHTGTTTTTLTSTDPLVFEIHRAGQSDFANAGIPYGASERITLTVSIDQAGDFLNSATVDGGGLELNEADNTDDASVISALWRLLLPYIQRP